MILGPCGTNITLTLSPPAPPPSREGAPPPRELNAAVIPTKFDVLDSDGDGRITEVEYQRGFDLLDKDKNGFVTREEFGLASAATFNLLDRNGNNRVTKMEYTAGISLATVARSVSLYRSSSSFFPNLVPVCRGEVCPSSLDTHRQLGDRTCFGFEIWH